MRLVIKSQVQEFCIVLMKQVTKQYLQAFILRNGTKMQNHVIKITSSRMPDYFSDLLQCLLVESGHE